MAKQSGLHQIRGKVGEHSYYKQSGVASGLIRSINQGMSARVKNGAEYANTRLNNQEFGAACDTAGLLGKMVTPKFRPMILPFSQSKMSKEILRLARENSSAWGQRTISSAQTAQIASVLSAQSKRDIKDFVNFELDYEGENDFNALVSFDAQQAALMLSLGITGITVAATAYDLASGNWSAAGQQMLTGYLEKVDTADVMDNTAVVVGGAQDSATLQVPSFIPPAGHTAHQIVVFVALPIRTVEGTQHILQEYCSFAAVELPARA